MFTIPYVSCVTCHMSRVTCHMSHGTCHMSHVTCKKKKEKGMEIVDRGSVINGAYPVLFIYFCINISMNFYHFKEEVNKQLEGSGTIPPTNDCLQIAQQQSQETQGQEIKESETCQHHKIFHHNDFTVLTHKQLKQEKTICDNLFFLRNSYN